MAKKEGSPLYSDSLSYTSNYSRNRGQSKAFVIIVTVGLSLFLVLAIAIPLSTKSNDKRIETRVDTLADIQNNKSIVEDIVAKTQLSSLLFALPPSLSAFKNNKINNEKEENDKPWNKHIAPETKNHFFRSGDSEEENKNSWRPWSYNQKYQQRAYNDKIPWKTEHDHLNHQTSLDSNNKKPWWRKGMKSRWDINTGHKNDDRNNYRLPYWLENFEDDDEPIMRHSEWNIGGNDDNKQRWYWRRSGRNEEDYDGYEETQSNGDFRYPWNRRRGRNERNYKWREKHDGNEEQKHKEPTFPWWLPLSKNDSETMSEIISSKSNDSYVNDDHKNESDTENINHSWWLSEDWRYRNLTDEEIGKLDNFWNWWQQNIKSWDERSETNAKVDRKKEDLPHSWRNRKWHFDDSEPWWNENSKNGKTSDDFVSWRRNNHRLSTENDDKYFGDFTRKPWPELKSDSKNGRFLEGGIDDEDQNKVTLVPWWERDEEIKRWSPWNDRKKSRYENYFGETNRWEELSSTENDEKYFGEYTRKPWLKPRSDSKNDRFHHDETNNEEQKEMTNTPWSSWKDRRKPRYENYSENTDKWKEFFSEEQDNERKPWFDATRNPYWYDWWKRTNNDRQANYKDVESKNEIGQSNHPVSFWQKKKQNIRDADEIKSDHNSWWKPENWNKKDDDVDLAYDYYDDISYKSYDPSWWSERRRSKNFNDDFVSKWRIGRKFSSDDDSEQQDQELYNYWQTWYEKQNKNNSTDNNDFSSQTRKPWWKPERYGNGEKYKNGEIDGREEQKISTDIPWWWRRDKENRKWVPRNEREKSEKSGFEDRFEGKDTWEGSPPETQDNGRKPWLNATRSPYWYDWWRRTNSDDQAGYKDMENRNGDDKRNEKYPRYPWYPSYSDDYEVDDRKEKITTTEPERSTTQKMASPTWKTLVLSKMATTLQPKTSTKKPSVFPALQCSAVLNGQRMDVDLKDYSNQLLYEIARIQTSNIPQSYRFARCSKIFYFINKIGDNYTPFGAHVTYKWLEYFGPDERTLNISLLATESFSDWWEEIDDENMWDNEKFEIRLSIIAAVDNYVLTYECSTNVPGEPKSGYIVRLLSKHPHQGLNQNGQNLLQFANSKGLNPGKLEPQMINQSECSW
ncbi:hypothetical protein HELRODRAFT_182463 [Helobdella robusta]|uniref:Uncharacterized protein n=1 Tax=Helobdella robusta TaxID=6412 RepID=T1FI85_HELRO|nr:hypothetical protein HELRODRAFT_182463 [Helobdella robusta]ESN90990.1 hypothetical protein HELRODRAFT_182463 [Helobdella robusta]